MSPRLVLASTSRYRRELLERLDVPFDVAAPAFDERALDAAFARDGDAAFALRLARGKGESLRARYPDAAILAADQIAVLPGPPPVLLHKPGSVDAAVAQLMSLTGRTHHLTTAVVLLVPDRPEASAVDVHALTMRAFSEAEARAYVERYQPLDCVGAYRIEDAGIALFDSIRGDDHTGIIGLPLLAVSRLLRQAGLQPRGPSSGG